MVTRLSLAQFGRSGFRHPGHGAIEGPFGEGRGGSIFWIWNIAVDHKPPPMGKLLFFVDSIRKSCFISSSFCGFLAARSFA